MDTDSASNDGYDEFYIWDAKNGKFLMHDYGNSGNGGTFDVMSRYMKAFGCESVEWGSMYILITTERRLNVSMSSTIHPSLMIFGSFSKSRLERVTEVSKSSRENQKRIPGLFLTWGFFRARLSRKKETAMPFLPMPLWRRMFLILVLFVISVAPLFGIFDIMEYYFFALFPYSLSSAMVLYMSYPGN